jgi:hypothetical protein
MFFILISTHLHAKFVSFPNIATESLPNFARSLIVHFLKTERMPQQTEVLNVLHPKSMHFLHVFPLEKHDVVYVFGMFGSH